MFIDYKVESNFKRSIMEALQSQNLVKTTNQFYKLGEFKPEPNWFLQRFQGIQSDYSFIFDDIFIETCPSSVFILKIQSNLIDENCKPYDDRRNVERILATHFHTSNLSSGIPAGVIRTHFVKCKKISLIN